MDFLEMCFRCLGGTGVLKLGIESVSYTHLARWLHKQLVAEVPVIKKVVKNAKRLKCNYLVFPVPSKKKQLYMETKGFYLIGQVNEYGIFKYCE